MKLKYISSDLKAMYISSDKKQSQNEITVEQVKKHLEALVEDTLMIESGLIAVPKYEIFIERKVVLEGLLEYGKGDWKSISRFCVVTITPTQFVSHAQKYFLHHDKNSAELSHQIVNGDW
ncbi:hypothetical protein ACFX2C_026822 [Malus domestica]